MTRPNAAWERDRWSAWKAISDRIVARPDYRYGAPNVRLLIGLATFAMTMLGKHNTAYWNEVNK